MIPTATKIVFTMLIILPSISLRFTTANAGTKVNRSMHIDAANAMVRTRLTFPAFLCLIIWKIEFQKENERYDDVSAHESAGNICARVHSRNANTKTDRSRLFSIWKDNVLRSSKNIP